MAPVEVDRSFAAEPNAPMLARQQVRRILRDAMPAERLDDLGLATSELVTSAVINGRLTGQEVISVSVGLDEELDVVRVTVEQPIRPHPTRAMRSRQPGLFTSAVVLDTVTDRWAPRPARRPSRGSRSISIRARPPSNRRRTYASGHRP